MTSPGRSNKFLSISVANLPPLVSIAAAAEITGVSPKTIRRRIADQTLKAVRVGGDTKTIRIQRDSLIEMLRPIGVA